MQNVERAVLSVGGVNQGVPLPWYYQGWRCAVLDIDPAAGPDVVADARDLATFPAGSYDAVYCSHNLEHYFRHDVPKVLAGFMRVLKPDGFAEIRVPDLGALMRIVVERDIDIDDVLYESGMGPVTVRDVIYGYAPEIERSGNDFYAHKTGFTLKSLRGALHAGGFKQVVCAPGDLEIVAFAFSSEVTAFHRELLGLTSA